jgi:histidyl-tRNA synthetase
MGDMVVAVVLEELGLLPADRNQSPARIMVTVFDEQHQLTAYQLSAELRRSGLDVVTYPNPDKLGKQFRHADRIGAQVALIIGPEEESKGEVALKDLTSREQSVIPRSQLSEALRALLDKGSDA